MHDTRQIRKRIFATCSDNREKLQEGGVAQMVERSLSMREVRGSMPLSSNFSFLILAFLFSRTYLLSFSSME